MLVIVPGDGRRPEQRSIPVEDGRQDRQVLTATAGRTGRVDKKRSTSSRSRRRSDRAAAACWALRSATAWLAGRHNQGLNTGYSKRLGIVTDGDVVGHPDSYDARRSVVLRDDNHVNFLCPDQARSVAGARPDRDNGPQWSFTRERRRRCHHSPGFGRRGSLRRNAR